MKLITLFMIGFLLSIKAYSGIIYYVDADASGTNSGTSWVNAFTDLQDALSTANAFDQIWVADGIYKPTSGLDRTISFEPPNAVTIIGGFAGGENDPSDSNPFANPTKLSGNIGAPDDSSDNSENVFSFVGIGGPVVIVGFIIEDGQDDTGLGQFGAGALITNSEVDFINCLFRRNYASNGGGAIFADGDANFVNCEFRNNSTDQFGGAVFINNGPPSSFTDCKFKNNSAVEGGAFIASGECYLDRCQFNSNTALISGGAFLSLNSGFQQITNSLFFRNSGDVGTAIQVIGGTLDLRNVTITENFADNPLGASTVDQSGLFGNINIYNSILWGNDTEVPLSANNVNLTHCVIEGGFAGNQIFDIEPQFIDPLTDDFHIWGTSPAFDSGNDILVVGDFDLDGNPRFAFDAVDIGAYEAVSCAKPHDFCENATFLVLDNQPLQEDNICATSDGDGPALCDEGNGLAVWYTLQGSICGDVDLIVSNIEPVNDDEFLATVVVYNGTCDNLNELYCANSPGPNQDVVIEAMDLTPGLTYYFRIQGASNQEGIYDIAVNSACLPCPSDFNGDYNVTVADLLLFLSEFGCDLECSYDLNGDGIVGTSDLLIFLSTVGPCD